MPSTSLIQMPDQHTMIKAAVAGGAYAAGEYYVLNNRDTMGVAYNGLATAGGILAISTVDEAILSVLNWPFVKKGEKMGGFVKGMEQRVLEVAGGVTGSLILSQFVFKTAMPNPRDLGMKVGMIVAADLLGEAVADMFMGNALDLFD